MNGLHRPLLNNDTIKKAFAVSPGKYLEKHTVRIAKICGE